MKADGSVVRCSRSENKELFSLALGGYGLFGVILDADLRVVPNERLRLERHIVPLDQAMESFERKLREKPGVRMVYARMNITPQGMFDEVLVNMFYPEGGPIPLLTEAGSRWLPRVVFRGSASSAYGKELRWSAETKIQPYLTGKVFSRNQLMNDNAEWYLDRSAVARIFPATAERRSILDRSTKNHTQAQRKPAECNRARCRNRQRHISQIYHSADDCLCNVLQPATNCVGRCTDAGNDARTH